jgi:hypothetical protein
MNEADQIKQQLVACKKELDKMKQKQLETGKYTRLQLQKKQSEFIRLSNKHRKLILGY